MTNHVCNLADSRQQNLFNVPDALAPKASITRSHNPLANLVSTKSKQN